MKTFIVSIFLLLFITPAFAQNFYASSATLTKEGKTTSDENSQGKSFEFFDYSLDSEDKADLSKVGNHFLGKEIAYQFQVMEKLYTFKTPIGPGNPGMKTVIQKPDIYNCIHKINKSLKKQLKKSEISEDKAFKEMEHYLAVVIAIISQDTEDFEAALKNAKSVENQVKILQNTTLKTL